MIYNCYDVILEGYHAQTEQDAVDWAAGFVFSECEKSNQRIDSGEYVDTVNGIDVYYDYSADYYFFCDEG